ncbi:MAG: hypothetical protein ABW223_06765, partial [Rariglobus sp.]
MKKFLIILGSLLALVAIGLFIASFFLGSIVTKGVNTYGPRITGTTVTLDSATISPFSGSGTLNKLFVGNPTGWKSEKAFSFAKVHLSVVPKSLTGEHVIVNEMHIDGPEFIYETRIVASNIQDLLANIEKNTGGGSGQNPSQQPTTDEGKPRKFEVKSLRLENAKVTVMAGSNVITVPMPPLIMTDVGTKEGGLTADQLAIQVVRHVLREITQVVAQSALKNGIA